MATFESHGHPGRWWKSVEVSGSVLDTTGSMYGAAGLIVTSATPATGTVLLSKSEGGSAIDLQYLNAGELYEFSIERVTVNGIAYVLYRNPPSRW